MANVSAERAADESAVAFNGGVLLLLEGAATQTRQVIRDAAAVALFGSEAKLPAAVFARHGFQPTPALIAAGLAGSGSRKVDAEELAATLQAAADSYLTGKAKLPDGLSRLLEAAQKRGLAIGVLTALPEATAQAALAQLGFKEGEVRLFPCTDPAKGFPRADLWVKAAKAIGRSPRTCFVVADDSASCKSALAGGLRCLAVPAALAAHQDFCGADVILDDWQDMSSREILDSVLPPA